MDTASPTMTETDAPIVGIHKYEMAKKLEEPDLCVQV